MFILILFRLKSKLRLKNSWAGAGAGAGPVKQYLNYKNAMAIRKGGGGLTEQCT
jgi:hypothetical protein